MNARREEKADVADRVLQVIAEELAFPRGELLPETIIRDEIGADSLDVIELLIALESKFYIEIPDEMVVPSPTVGQLQEAVWTLVALKQGN